MTAPPQDWPPPAAPLHPVASWGSLRGGGTSVPAVDRIGSRLDVISGRVALAHALRLLGLGAGSRVLLPAYHCTAMVEPVEWVGAQPVFYRVTEGLEPDYDDLARLAEGADVLVAVHYFGFPQDLARLDAFCRERGIALIEDCAHAFFGSDRGVPLGSVGEFAIASWWKFFPVRDGGCLVSARRDLATVEVSGAGAGFELRSFVRALDAPGEYGRLQPVSGAVRGIQKLRALARRGGSGAVPNRITNFSLGSPEFDPFWFGKRWSRTSRRLAAWAGRDRIVERRRRNYRALAERLAGEGGVRLLHPEPGGDVVPYVVPVLFDDAAAVFPELKRRGVPLLRFGEILWPAMDRARCPVTDDYSDRLFQLPCHQELSPEEIEWIATQVRESMRKASE